MGGLDQRRPTSADVAREAGLSRTTVSYVLNRNPRVSFPEATRRRVHAAAERLSYAPSAAARELRSGRSDLVLCLLPDWPLSPEVGVLLENLSNALSDQGFTLVAHPRARSTRPVSEIWKAMRPAAVVSFEPFEDRDLVLIRAAGIELTVPLFCAAPDGETAMAVTEERKGRLQAEHLAAGGHRHLGYALTADDRLLGFAHPRLRGVRRACAELGLDEPVTRVVPLDPAPAAAAIRSWRSRPDPVTAVCAFNDEVAFAVLAGAHELGLTVPGELAVIGVDDIPTACVATPPLTTVRTDQARFAGYFADVIVRRVGHQPDPPRPGSDILTVVGRRSG